MPGVLVTGASRGIGRALVELYLGRGWTTFALVRSAGSCPEGAVPIVADVRDDATREAVAGVLAARAEPLDLLVNNAGIGGRGMALESVEPSEMLDLFQTHCLGALRCTQAALPYLMRAGRPTVVNVTSRLGSIARSAAGDFDAERHSYAYRVAKASLNMLTVCMAAELRPAGVRVLAVHPGTVRTGLGPASAPFSADEAAANLAGLVETAGDLGPAFLGPDGLPVAW
jgi:NAD(P)-dependent dehydrogenase (short-subunit alcohol dehydrogenase family)